MVASRRRSMLLDGHESEDYTGMNAAHESEGFSSMNAVAVALC